MILSDNETKVDMLNNRAIAMCIMDLILESSDQPLSVGVHGDWGAGKSSVLEMVADEIDKIQGDKKIAYVRFNGWKHQGFEDAKIALMAGVISELEKHYSIREKAKDTVEKIWKNINWMGAAKNAGKLAVSIATGTMPLAILGDTLAVLKSNIADEEKISSAMEKVADYLGDAKVFEDTSANKEFSEFRDNLEELLARSKIEKLVVLIDDLDRCLPNVAIETLEAVRLFMFTKSTAFVIAADETMIRYAVKKYFPDLKFDGDFSNAYFSDRYLEKLIQIPFRIPALGEVESSLYITLLLVGSKLELDSREYEELQTAVLEKLKKPWQIRNFTISELRGILKDKYEMVSDEIFIAMQVYPLLSKNTQGNPRKIKRFLNMLLLRKNIATARGYGEELKLPILAKMMIAEYYYPTFYKNIAAETNQYGIWPAFEVVGSKGETEAEETEMDPPLVKIVRLPEWAQATEFAEWADLEPSLIDVDLRPYYFVSKEKEDYFFHSNANDTIQMIYQELLGPDMQVAAMSDKIKNITPEDAEVIYELLTAKISQTSNFDEKPKGIEGLKNLIKYHENLQSLCISFLQSIPYDKIGVWICSGWDGVFTQIETQKQFEVFLDGLREKGNSRVRAILKTNKRSK